MRIFWSAWAGLYPALQFIERAAYVINAAICGFVVALALFLLIAGWL
tara:strand:+ start:224 stop:364 length:141 start_codon:yes stop_codon:yes gene_type:complete